MKKLFNAWSYVFQTVVNNALYPEGYYTLVAQELQIYQIG